MPFSRRTCHARDFALVISVAITSLQLVWYLSDQFVGFTEAWGKCKQGLTVITAPHDVVDAPNAESISITKGRIVFEHVTFHYPAQHRLFNDKNIIIEAGQKVGLVGTSGSGKTTFANLILRNFDVDQGRILIDDQRARHQSVPSQHNGKYSLWPARRNG